MSFVLSESVFRFFKEMISNVCKLVDFHVARFLLLSVHLLKVWPRGAREKPHTWKRFLKNTSTRSQKTLLCDLDFTHKDLQIWSNGGGSQASRLEIRADMGNLSLCSSHHHPQCPAAHVVPASAQLHWVLPGKEGGACTEATCLNDEHSREGGRQAFLLYRRHTGHLHVPDTVEGS